MLQIHTRYREVGGEDIVADAEVKLLRAAGHEVRQLLTHNPELPLQSAVALAAAPWNVRAASAVRAEARAFRPDVAHIHNTWFALSPAVITELNRLGVPVVLTLHNFRLFCSNAMLLRDGGLCELCVGSHPWHAVRYRCYRDSAGASMLAAGTIALHRRLGTWTKSTSVLLAPSVFVRDQYRAAGFPEDKIWVKQNTAPDPGPRAQPPSASRTILYVGRLSREKGVLFLLDVWRHYATQDLELELVGAGPLAAPLQRHLPDGVRLVGRLAPQDVRARMQSARAVMVPSLSYETSSMVTIEAMAAGLPVVASDLGALTDTAGAIGEEWLREPEAYESWGSALRALTDDAHVDGGGQSARAAFEARHTPKQGLRMLEEAYRAVRGSSN